MSAEEYLALPPDARSSAWEALSPVEKGRVRDIEADLDFRAPAKAEEESRPFSATLCYSIAWVAALTFFPILIRAMVKSSLTHVYLAGSAFVLMTFFWALGDIVKVLHRRG